MTQHETNGGALQGVLEGLAASRGYTLGGLAEETRRRGHDYTPGEIAAGGRGGFGSAIDDVLRLDDGERGRLVQGLSDDMNARILGRKAGNVPPEGDGPGSPEAPGFARYSGENPREDGGPWCCVSHPDAGGPCGRAAVGAVWGLQFCDAHHAEAEAAALSEMWGNARAEITASLEAARPRWRRNGALLVGLRAAQDDAQRRGEDADSAQEKAAETAYGDADDAATDPETLRYNGDPFAGAPEWWHETCVMVLRFMREAHDAALPTLVRDLEPARERATVQEILAIRRELSRPSA